MWIIKTDVIQPLGVIFSDTAPNFAKCNAIVCSNCWAPCMHLKQLSVLMPRGHWVELRGLFRHWAQRGADQLQQRHPRAIWSSPAAGSTLPMGTEGTLRTSEAEPWGRGEDKHPAPRLREQSNPGHPGWSMLLTWKMHYFFWVLRSIRGLHVQQCSGLKQAWRGTWLPVKGVTWAGVVSPLPALNPWTC